MITREELQSLGFNTRRAASPTEIKEAEESVGQISSELSNLLRISNGLKFEWFTLYPVYIDTEKKQTWDSLQRANDPTTSKFTDDSEFLEKFLIVSELSGNNFAVICKADNTIWFTDEGELSQTDLDIWEFLKVITREVNEL